MAEFLQPVPPPPPPPACQRCIYWRLWTVQPRHDPGRHLGQFGDCRRHSPAVMKNDAETPPRTKWPSTEDHDFCGDYTPLSSGGPIS
jgi:hypothetical protein